MNFLLFHQFDAFIIHWRDRMVMGTDRVLAKARKLAKRLANKIDELSDSLEDLELEFAMLIKTIDKLESKQGSTKTVASDVQIDVAIEVQEDDDFDVTNTSAPSAKVRRKF